MQKDYYLPIKTKGRIISSPTYKTRILEKYCKKHLLDKLSEDIQKCSSKPIASIFSDINKTLVRNRHIEYVIKVDIKHFFDSVDTDKLLKETLAPHFNDDELKFNKLFIGDGIKTGSTLASIYSDLYLKQVLSELDSLESIVDYVRYVDDFLFFVSNKENPNDVLKEIKKIFLKANLNLKDEKIYIKTKYDKTNSYLGFNFWFKEHQGKVICRCKKLKQKKIEKKYTEFYNRIQYVLTEEQDNEEKLASLIREMNYYTLSIFNYYRHISTSLQKDFYFSNKILRNIATLIGYFDEVRLTRHNNITMIYDSYSPNTRNEINSSVFILK